MDTSRKPMPSQDSSQNSFSADRQAQGSAGKKEGLGSTKANKFKAFQEKKLANKKLVTLADWFTLATGEIPSGAWMTEKTLCRIRECSTLPELATPEDFSKFKKIGGHTCRNAFCPVCQMYQSRRDSLKIGAVMDWMHETRGMEFIAATLTVPNVRGHGLKLKLAEISSAFRNLVKRLNRKNTVFHGFARKLEVTYNKEPRITRAMWYGDGKRKKPMKGYFAERGLKITDPNPNYGTYHPHFHVVFAVVPSYFTSRDYVPQEQWLEMWRETMRDPSITQVHVQRCYKTKGTSGDATFEIAKYVAKDSDYLHSQEVFNVFYESLKGCRRLTFGGLFSEGAKLFKEGMLDRWLPGDDAVYKWAIVYEWQGELFAEKAHRALTPEQAARVAGMKYSEAYDTEDF